MFLISKNASVTVSIVLAALFLAGIVCGAVMMPWLAGKLIDISDSIDDRTVTDAARTFVLVVAYLLLSCGALADVLLLCLLRTVRRGSVFSAKSVRLLRGIAFCCLAAGVLFAAIGKWFLLSFVVAFVAAFAGICLFVVKNVIEEATAIKSENDFTI